MERLVSLRTYLVVRGGVRVLLHGLLADQEPHIVYPVEGILQRFLHFSHFIVQKHVVVVLLLDLIGFPGQLLDELLALKYFDRQILVLLLFVL